MGFVVLMAASLLGGPSGPDDRWLGLRGAAALAAAPCPSQTSIEMPMVSPARVAAARERTFDVFGPKPTELGASIDWHTDPLDAERYRQNLHKLRFITPLLSSYAYSGNDEDLAEATQITLDWVRHNPIKDPDTPAEAWSDKVVGDRAPFIAYVARAAACEGLLSAAQRRALLDSLERHGRELAAKRNYAPDNHGLFVDLGLARLTSFLPVLAQSPQWRALARDRFEETLRRLADRGRARAEPLDDAAADRVCESLEGVGADTVNHTVNNSKTRPEIRRPPRSLLPRARQARTSSSLRGPARRTGAWPWPPSPRRWQVRGASRRRAGRPRP